MIVGVTSSPTPNGLNSIVVVGKPFVVFEATGTGNSPPARKAAGWPLVAVKFGSASVVNKFSCASASSVASISRVAPADEEADRVPRGDYVVGNRVVGVEGNAPA